MSTPPKKVSQDQRAEEVYYTQELLTEIFAAPITNLMQESAQQYILTGKFKNLVPAMQTSMQALWDRAMYAGIADAEYEIDSLRPSKSDMGFSLSSFSNQVSLIEFATDPQLARIDGLLKDRMKYLEEVKSLSSQKDIEEVERQIDLLRIERELVKNPKSSVARRIGEKIRLENELNLAKEQGNFGRVTAIRQELKARQFEDSSSTKTKPSPKPPGPVSEERPEIRKVKKVITTRSQLRDDISEARVSNKNTVIGEDKRLKDLLSFSPKGSAKDLLGEAYQVNPKIQGLQQQINKEYARNQYRDEEKIVALKERIKELRFEDTKINQKRRLVYTNTSQMYATLNERYPAVGTNSIFAQDYLKYRQSTVAISLQQQYQDKIKSVVSKYVADEKVGESTTLKRIQKVYQDDKLNVWYKPLIEDLESKYEESKFSKPDYEKFLRKKLKGLEIDPDTQGLDTDRLIQEEERLSLLPNPTKKQQARMEELERILDSAQSTKSEDGKRSKYLSALRNLQDPEADPNKRYINPEARIKLPRLERERLIKLNSYEDESYASNLAQNIRDQEDFSYKEIRSFVQDLRREGGRFDDSLYAIAARTAATETAAAYSIGRLQTYIERGVNYVQWIANMDARTSVFCQSLHRKIFAVRDLIPAAMAKQTFPKTRLPEWDPANQSIKNAMGINTWMVPAHPYAYLPNTRVASTGIELLMRKRYVGKSVTIKTETGNTLSVTVEHPILTDRGFIRAGELKGGEYIFDTFDSQGCVISNPDYQASIPTVENLFELSRVSQSLVRGIMPVPTKDLDSNITNNKINVVGKTGHLLEDVSVTQSRQNLIELLFQRADMGLASEPIDGVFNTIFLSPLALSPGIVSRSYHLPSLFGSLPCVEDLLGTGEITDSLSTLSKNAFNNTSLYTKSLADFSESHSSTVSFYNNLSEFSRELPNPILSKEMSVKRTQIVDIVIEDYDGFVYHVQDSSGINVANGIISHNCRSFFSPIYTDDQKVGDKYPPKGFPPDADLNKYLLADLIERKGLFEGLTPNQKKLYLEEIVQSQNKMRESKTAKILRSMGNLQDMFNMGLSYLTRRLKQDKVANFTVDEIKKNDKQLVSALVGGAAVLGTGAMMYFFMKSNLAKTLTEYLKVNAGIAIGGLTKDAVGKLLKDLIKSSKTANSMPDSVKDLIGEPVVDEATLGEKLELATQNGELVFEMAATGQLTIDEINQLISAGVTGVNRQGKLNALTRAALNSAMNTRRQLNESALNILNQAFVNKGGAIDPTKITSIQDFVSVYRVGVAGQRGTFVSKKAFDAVMGSRDVQQELGRLQEQIERIESGLDGLESVVDPDDEIGQALLRQERAQQRSVKAMIDSIRTKMASPDYINARSAAEMQESFTPEITQMVNQVIESESDYKDVLDALFADFAATLPSNRLIQGLVPENIDSVTELKAIQKLFKQSLAEVRRDFLTKNQPYTPATAARKRRPELSQELLDAAQRAENQALRLNNQGFTYNSNLSDLDKYYKDRINSELQTILELDTRISNRIKELE